MCEHCPERGTLCPNCGADPCYHLCPNSVAFYSAEQEREDDAWYGMDDERERYASTTEPSQYDDIDYRSGDTTHDQRPCPGCGVMTEPYAPCGSPQCFIGVDDDGFQLSPNYAGPVNNDDIPF